jgi:hypothetical protein
VLSQPDQKSEQQPDGNISTGIATSVHAHDEYEMTSGKNEIGWHPVEKGEMAKLPKPEELARLI